MCWFGERPLRVGDRLRVKHTTRVTPAVVDERPGPVRRERARLTEADELATTRSAWSRLRTATPLAVDPYARTASPAASSSSTSRRNATIAAGMVGPAAAP